KSLIVSNTGILSSTSLTSIELDYIEVKDSGRLIIPLCNNFTVDHTFILTSTVPFDLSSNSVINAYSLDWKDGLANNLATAEVNSNAAFSTLYNKLETLMFSFSFPTNSTVKKLTLNGVGAKRAELLGSNVTYKELEINNCNVNFKND